MSATANHISPATHIMVKGARQHNLKNVDLVLPKGKLVVFTGLSGSGKSSFAFDTIYAEGQRKYVESLSSYARQFLGIMQKPDVDQIDGLSPAISIDQKTTSHNPRSTVGTITEIYDYLRLLFARIGHPHCPQCGQEIAPQSLDQIARQTLELIKTSTTRSPQARWMILSPVVRDKKGEFSGLLENLSKKGLQRVRIDGHVFDLDEDIALIKTNRHTISAILDRLTADSGTFKSAAKEAEYFSRITHALEQALDLSQGLAIITQVHDNGLSFPEKPQQFTDHLFSQHLACPACNISLPEIEPRIFSFNTPHGACPTCTGLGTLLKVDAHKIVAPDLTMSEGAIIPLANALASDSWYARKINSILEAHAVDPKTPYKFLPEPVQRILLYGDKRFYRVSGSNRQGREASFTFQPEGIVNELERRYQETQSDFMRAEIERFMRREICPECQGTRLKPEALAVTITGQNIHQITQLPIIKSFAWIDTLRRSIKLETDTLLSRQEKVIAASILREIVVRLDFLISVGLDYLTLNREAATLAGGEAQRIRLASQIGTGLTGVLYVLDEPTIGLHPRDNDRLIKTLVHLRDLGNSVLVVEHDKHVILAADEVVDFGPGAGDRGGKVVAQGTPLELAHNPQSLTGKYLNGTKTITNRELKQKTKELHHSLRQQFEMIAPTTDGKSITLKGVSEHNLKNVDITFPLGKFITITGVSGSGKSSLVHDTLYPALKFALNQHVDELGKYAGLDGSEYIDKANLIDQSPIGRTPRSNPATYTKTFDYIRQIFAGTKEAKMKGYTPGRFSFNVKGGRCEACQGDGQVKISMQFLSDVYVTCEVCGGKRYNQETLSIKYQELSIADVLNLTVDESLELFKNHSSLTKRLATLQAVGLGYIKLGQPAPTLSGGEAQRVKLAKELSVNSSGHTVYLLDEPTTGLHFEDVKHLLIVLKQLVDHNNTVIVIEHNLDVIKNSDWIIDLGPEGGDRGGEVVAAGTPAEVASHPTSHTAKYLREEVNP